MQNNANANNANANNANNANMQDITLTLNEHDMFALEQQGWEWSATARELALLNRYLRKGERNGAHWGSKRATALVAAEDTVLVSWTN